ncbi:hypothetical protein ACWHAJ_13265, partial [Prescottella equi]
TVTVRAVAASAAHLKERGGDMTSEQHFDQDPGPDAWAGDTLGAAEAMSDDELDAAIDALTARERRCLIGGNVEYAKSLAHDKWVCITVRTNRNRLSPGS